MSSRTNILQFDGFGLQNLMTDLGQKPYRAWQLVEWLYLRGAGSFSDMDNLPKSLRVTLNEAYVFWRPEIIVREVDPDKTVRYLLKLGDGLFTETVAIPSATRLTVCFSTQVGCALGCVFCATGALGFSRSLLVGEMLMQLSVVAEDFKNTRISNVVAMGQGEPFAAYDDTLSALRMINDPRLFGIGARHITVSTAGLIKQIRRFSLEPEQFTLAISLHSADQKIRDLLMPGLRNQPLVQLRKALISYMEKTSRRPTLEYALIDGVNDTDEALAALLAFCRVPAPGFHVNLLSLHAGKAAGEQHADAQKRAAEKAGGGIYARDISSQDALGMTSLPSDSDELASQGGLVETIPNGILCETPLLGETGETVLKGALREVTSHDALGVTPSQAADGTFFTCASDYSANSTCCHTAGGRDARVDAQQSADDTTRGAQKHGLFLPELKKARPAAFCRFERALKDAGVSVSRRVSKGESIAAACGQLSGRISE